MNQVDLFAIVVDKIVCRVFNTLKIAINGNTIDAPIFSTEKDNF